MIVNIRGNDGNSDDVAALIDDVPDVLILHTDNILTIDLKEIMVHQETIPCSRGVNSNGGDFALLKLKPNMP